jgi:hypothetical protein
VSFTLHFWVPCQLAQYFSNHPWNRHRRSQVLVPRLSGALALSSVSLDDASDAPPLDVSLPGLCASNCMDWDVFQLYQHERLELYISMRRSYAVGGRSAKPWTNSCVQLLGPWSAWAHLHRSVVMLMYMCDPVDDCYFIYIPCIVHLTL